jgi:Rad3-related DNA helicase
MPEVGFLEASTGSGKSACSKAISSASRTIVLTATKSLQDQYGDIYHATVLKGKSNYPCVHPKAKRYATCEDCLFSEKGMGKCPYKQDCEYLHAKFAALRSHFSCLNYAYWLTSRVFSDTHQGFLVCDEGHNLPDQVISRSGTTISERRRLEFDMPEFPAIREAKGILAKMEDPVSPSIDWLSEAIVQLRIVYSQLQAEAEEDPAKYRKARHAEYLGLKLRATIEAFAVCADEWYIESVPGSHFSARPLTARNHFRSLFAEEGRQVVVMSATLGNPATLASELGLADGEWASRVVPNVWPAWRRPIYRLPAPRLSYNSPKSHYDKQADLIAEAILSCPKDWAGIIHVTRKTEAKLLADRLARRGLQDRVWVTPRTGTSEQLEAWEIRKAKFPGSLMLSWSHHEGFNGLDERICVTAKVQFPALGDPYEKRRFEFSKEMYQQRAAQTMEQSQGRTRRGREEDYDTKDERRGLNVIADENVRMIKRFFSEGFKDALVKGMPE